MRKRMKGRILLSLLCTALAAGCSSSNVRLQTSELPFDQDEQAAVQIIRERGIGNMTVSYVDSNEGIMGTSSRTRMSASETKNAVDRSSVNNLPPVSNMKSESKKKRTVMVYLIGSDLESDPRSKAGTTDISEMMDSGLDDKDTNLVVLAGGSNTWWNGLPGKKNSYLVYSSDNGGDFHAYDFGSDNMSSQKTLEEFLNTTVERFPAEQYSLIFWDHGSGPYMGYGHDEVYDEQPDEGKLSNSLTLDDITGAIDHSALSDETIEMIGFDACLMGSIEIANAMAPYTSTMVASAETEPGCGWDYSWLNILNEQPDTQTYCQKIVDSYAQFILERNPSLDYTLAVYDLSEAAVEKTNEAYESFVSSIREHAEDTDGFSDLVISGLNCQYYGHDYIYELFDADSLAECFDGCCKSDALRDDLVSIVSYGQTNMPKSSGLSFYLPLGATDTGYAYKTQSWAREYRSDQISELEEISLQWLSELEEENESSNTRAVEFEEEEDVYRLPLSEEMAGKAVRAKAVIMSNLFDEDFSVVAMQDLPLEMEEDTVLLDKDPEVIMAGDGVSKGIVRARFTQSNDDRRDYAVEAYLRTSGLTDTLFENVHARVDLKEENGRITVRSITNLPRGGEQVLYDEASQEESNEQMSALIGASRLDLAVDGLNLMYCPLRSGARLEDLDQGVLWKDCLEEGWAIGYQFDMSDGIEFSSVPISQDYAHSYIAQIILEDAAGNETVMGLMKFPEAEKPEIQVSTAQGTLYFESDGGEARLCLYEGSDSAIEIPQEASGLPVTCIGSDAFSDGGGSTLEEIVIPDSVETIESGAFYNLSALQSVHLPKGLEVIEENLFENDSALTELVLPDSVTTIKDGAFQNTGLHSLKLPASVQTIGEAVFAEIAPYDEDMNRLEFKLDVSANRNFMMKGNLLLSSDGKRLLCDLGYPKLDMETFSTDYPEKLVVPDGVETIDALAFTHYGTHMMGDAEDLEGVRELVLPDSLKEIGDYAFLGMVMLDSIDLPDHLEKLGAYAFGCTLFRVRPAQTIQIDIPASLSKIGYGAFEGYEGLHFEVDEDNTQYSAADGVLYNFAIDTPITVCFDGNEREIYSRAY